MAPGAKTQTNIEKTKKGTNKNKRSTILRLLSNKAPSTRLLESCYFGLFDLLEYFSESVPLFLLFPKFGAPGTSGFWTVFFGFLEVLWFFQIGDPQDLLIFSECLFVFEWFSWFLFVFRRLGPPGLLLEILRFLIVFLHKMYVCIYIYSSVM